MKIPGRNTSTVEAAGARPGGTAVVGERPGGRALPVRVARAVRTRDTRRAVIELLTESGPVTAGEIAGRLGLSAAGVRRHLDALIEAGDAQVHAVDAEDAADAGGQPGRGRPAKRYRLTADGRSKLGHRYDDLALAAMRQLREIGGEDAVRAFARRRIDGILAGVQPVGDADADVEVAAERITTALNKAGYAATTTRVNGQDGQIEGLRILQHHCPVAAVAKEFPELCQAEHQAMAEVLGTGVRRLGTIAGGAYVCTTHVPLAGQPLTGKHH